jgi:hypothetical protein
MQNDNLDQQKYIDLNESEQHFELKVPDSISSKNEILNLEENNNQYEKIPEIKVTQSDSASENELNNNLESNETSKIDKDLILNRKEFTAKIESDIKIHTFIEESDSTLKNRESVLSSNQKSTEIIVDKTDEKNYEDSVSSIIKAVSNNNEYDSDKLLCKSKESDDNNLNESKSTYKHSESSVQMPQESHMNISQELEEPKLININSDIIDLETKLLDDENQSTDNSLIRQDTEYDAEKLPNEFTDIFDSNLLKDL